MRSFRFLALAAVAAALVVVAPAIGDSGAAQRSTVPPAQVAGGDGPPPLVPSIVNTRLVRAQAALGRATASFDSGQPASAPLAMAAAADNLTKGWNAAKYVIQTAPPPPADDAFPDGSGGGGTAYMGAEDTASAVLAAEHDVVSTSVGMAETTNDALAKSLTSAINSMGNSRLAAIKYIHTLPQPPTDDGGAVGSTWSTVMPAYVAVLDDEIQQIKGRLALSKFSAAMKTTLTNARFKAQDTKDLINQWWPPVQDD